LNGKNLEDLDAVERRQLFNQLVSKKVFLPPNYLEQK
jgi:hypothetical protein